MKPKLTNAESTNAVIESKPKGVSIMAEKHAKDGVFTKRDIIRIRKGIGEGVPTETYAREFAVSLQCIRDLATGYTHSDMNAEAPPVELNHKHLKAQKKRERVLELLAEGLSQADVMRRLKVSEAYVSLVKNGKR